MTRIWRRQGFSEAFVLEDDAEIVFIFAHAEGDFGELFAAEGEFLADGEVFEGGWVHKSGVVIAKRLLAVDKWNRLRCPFPGLGINR